MKFETHIPCDTLRPYVKHFIITESDELRSYKVLPGTSLVMGFQYAGALSYLNNDIEVALTPAGITGLMDTYRIFKNNPDTGTVLVIFNETGAAHFFADPLNELFRESLYEFMVNNGSTIYYGDDGHKIDSGPKYDAKVIASPSSTPALQHTITIHQQGQTDFPAFCVQAAAAGVEKWIIDTEKMLCTYYDLAGNEMVAEPIPQGEYV